jgi:glycosyltransferase involved in cell wall biosynthesis
VINDITESTSPIKLFEYMAMGKPIVTTNMPECRKYQSVLIGKNHEEFIKKIDEALSLRDDREYKNILKKEAKANSWESKAKVIAEMLG